MYQLFYYPRHASWAPHMLLAEMNLDYQLILVDRKIQAQKDPAYLKLNPTGRIPTLVVGDHLSACKFMLYHRADKFKAVNLRQYIFDQMK